MYKCSSIDTLEDKMKQTDACTYLKWVILYLRKVNSSEATPYKQQTEMKAQESQCEH